MTALSSPSRLPDLTQRPIDGGGADRKQTVANLRRELKMSVPLHRIDRKRGLMAAYQSAYKMWDRSRRHSEDRQVSIKE